MKIRVFSEDLPSTVESAIQEWLDENSQISINTILQSESYIEAQWSLTITIFYIE